MENVFNVQVEGDHATLDIEGVIGQKIYSWFGVDEKNTREGLNNQLKALAGLKTKVKTVKARIFSPGGSFNHAMAMHDLLAQSGLHVITDITGMCASAATMLAQCGNPRRMSANALYLIHHAMTPPVGGNAKEIGTSVEALKVLDEAMINLYCRRAKKSRAEIEALMSANNDNGKWISAAEALEYGFVDEVYEPIDAVACAALPDAEALAALGLPAVASAGSQGSGNQGSGGRVSGNQASGNQASGFESVSQSPNLNPDNLTPDPLNPDPRALSLSQSPHLNPDPLNPDNHIPRALSPEQLAINKVVDNKIKKQTPGGSIMELDKEIFARVSGICGEAFAAKMVTDGFSAERCFQDYAAKVKTDFDAVKAQLTAKEAEAIAAKAEAADFKAKFEALQAGAPAVPNGVVAEKKDDGKETPKTFTAQVEDYAKEHECSKHEALAALAKAQPAAYATACEKGDF